MQQGKLYRKSRDFFAKERKTNRKRKGEAVTGHGRCTQCSIDVALELLAHIQARENKAQESESMQGESKARAAALSQYLYTWPLHGRPLGFLCNGIEILVNDGGALDVEYVTEGLKGTKGGSHRPRNYVCFLTHWL